MISGLSLLGIIFLRSYPAFAVPTVTTKDTVALAGNSTILSCSGLKITWAHTPLKAILDDYIYINKNISSKYWNLGFRMAANQNVNETNFVIENVTDNMAGKYVCKHIDRDEEEKADDDDNKPQSTQLIVLETLPECSVNVVEFVGPNVCNIPLNDIRLSCSVRYRGNKPPELEWSRFGDSEVLKSSCTTENGSQRTCHLTIKPDLDLHGSSFVCQTTQRAAKEQYSCTTKPITILYSFSSEASQRTAKRRGDEVVCVANSSVSCTYKWVWYDEVEDDVSRTIESKDNVLIAKKIGLHRCEAKCNLRNQTCLVFPKYVEVFPSDTNLNHSGDASPQRQQALQQENKQWTPSVICLLILGVLPYFAVGCYLLSRRRRKRTLARDRIPANEYDSQTEV